MLEVVIALTVIAIVSASAFALIHSHIKLEKQSVQSIEATNIAENAIECFRFANDLTSFENAYEAVVGKDVLPSPSSKTSTEGVTTYTYSYTDGAISVTFEIVENTSLHVVVEYGDASIEETYTKYVNK